MGPWLTEMKRFADKINNTAFVRVCVRFIRVYAAWYYTLYEGCYLPLLQNNTIYYLHMCTYSVIFPPR